MCFTLYINLYMCAIFYEGPSSNPSNDYRLTTNCTLLLFMKSVNLSRACKRYNFWEYFTRIVSLTKYVYMYKEYHSVRMSPLNSSLASECDPPLPPEPGGGGGGGAHSPAGEGLGEFQFRRLEKKLGTLPTLWFQFTVGVCQAKGRGGEGMLG
jgi:hypothetical protein